jgi:hypothetical protein
MKNIKIEKIKKKIKKIKIKNEKNFYFKKIQIYSKINSKNISCL